MDSIRIFGVAFIAVALGIALPVGVLTLAKKSDDEQSSHATHAAHASSGTENYLKHALEASVRAQGAAAAESEAALAQGKALYVTCVACHKEDGRGDKLLNSPALAGQEDWYLFAQLQKFKTGQRGTHPEDITGMTMAPMLAVLPGEADINAVVKYVATMPFVTQPATIEDGDAEKGKALYAVCAACHGPDGRGNRELNSPSIAGQSDWYIVNQLHKFKAGIRGYHADDITGKQMQPMAMTLADEQAMKDIATYVHGMR